MRRIAFALQIAAAVGWAGSALAASIPMPSCQQLFITGTCVDFNTLINNINTIIVPVLPTATPLAAGTGYVISPPPGSAANAQLGLSPNGSGNVVLFPNGTGLGLLQFGNQFSWFPAKGLAACPGTPPGQAPGLVGGVFGAAGPQSASLAIDATVSGYFAAYDWLGRPHFMVACG